MEPTQRIEQTTAVHSRPALTGPGKAGKPRRPALVADEPITADGMTALPGAVDDGAGCTGRDTAADRAAGTGTGSGWRAVGESSGRRRTSTEPLSAQEIQIAILASEGLSNHEIGHRLSISSGAVAARLYRIYSRLDITSRGRLAAALHDTRSAAAVSRQQLRSP
ncbi:response regulator transcription factor [Streptomyces sp. NPDC001315]|uniref:helix-turn-helix transcriptional regulator n=1 Tax=Streptomyces sp. NPDC001315 TaxID=3364562 RepID=UPI0036791830